MPYSTDHLSPLGSRLIPSPRPWSLVGSLLWVIQPSTLPVFILRDFPFHVSLLPCKPGSKLKELKSGLRELASTFPAFLLLPPLRSRGRRRRRHQSIHSTSFYGRKALYQAGEGGGLYQPPSNRRAAVAGKQGLASWGIRAHESRGAGSWHSSHRHTRSPRTGSGCSQQLLYLSRANGGVRLEKDLHGQKGEGGPSLELVAWID